MPIATGSGPVPKDDRLLHQVPFPENTFLWSPLEQRLLRAYSYERFERLVALGLRPLPLAAPPCVRRGRQRFLHHRRHVRPHVLAGGDLITGARAADDDHVTCRRFGRRPQHPIGRPAAGLPGAYPAVYWRSAAPPRCPFEVGVAARCSAASGAAPDSWAGCTSLVPSRAYLAGFVGLPPAQGSLPWR